jgi:CxxC motif-containing protein
METKYLSCIVCPLSCRLEAKMEGGEILSVVGNSCPRGETYARGELVSPRRVLTSTVKIENALLPLLPVVSAGTLPKDKLIDCALFLRTVKVDAPVCAGQAIVPDILGLGTDIVASRSMGTAHK